jgi:hypothetical protein
MANEKVRVQFGRALVGLVLFFNTQAALVFILFPGQYAPGFGLSGAVGAGMMRGMGILFLMWTVPYWVAFSHPVLRRVSLLEATAMQAIGLAGESLLLATFPEGYPQVTASVLRFIIFDGSGLLALLLAVAITWPVKSPRPI